FCTPSYALHMAETARNERIDLRATGVRTIVVAGEPGGSVPAIRERIERAWGARVVDHAGASEVGPWGFADSRARGLYINEGLFLPEFIDPATGRPAAPGDIAELVLTTLGRDGCPVIRYRTGDLVRPCDGPDEDCRFTFLDGGVLGRADDMLIIRGVNIFPQSIEAILREFPEIAEYRMTAFKEGAMDALEVEIEDGLNDPARVARELELRLGLKIEVRCVPPSTLPRFEGKGRRLKDQRRNN
ncbi:MAG TPA: phenylacetate--CoA ligase family protein, partial [Pirellulaceae bacterium]|nr:phenylacetate--CoA ligase family protein [Pirellulaceae bacterium]